MKRVSRRLLVSRLTDCFHAIRKQTGSRPETGALGLKPCSSAARNPGERERRSSSGQTAPGSLTYAWPGQLGNKTGLIRRVQNSGITTLAHTPSLARDRCFHAQLLRPSAGCELLGLSLTSREPERCELRVGSWLVCPEVTLALTQAYFVPVRDR